MAFRKSAFGGPGNPFRHWYRDNTVYFITARVRDGQHAFQSEQANAVFWDRFDHYTNEFGFTPWVTSLMDNHYHTEGYLKIGTNLGPMIQRIHGSVERSAASADLKFLV
jgi:hypothetical protein